MSLLTRTVLTPLHEISLSLGSSIRNFMQYLPSLWQIPASIGTLILTVLVIFMCCRYKIAFPFVSLEPNTSRKSNKLCK